MLTEAEFTIIKNNLEAQFRGEDMLTPCLVGSRGLGKTSTAKDLAKTLKAELLNISIPSKSIHFFSGIPEFSDIPAARDWSISKAGVPKGTTWSVPELIVQANTMAEEHGRCLILLDDFHKLEGGIQRSMYEFLLEGKLGDFKLNPNVAIIAAMNFSKESGAGQMEEPIKDRLALFKMELNFKVWYEKFGRYLHPYVSSFLKSRPDLVLEEESVSIESNASPRSWTHLSHTFNLHSKQFIKENSVVIAKQYIREATAIELARHITMLEAYNFRTVIDNKEFKDIKSRPLIERWHWAFMIHELETPEDAAFFIEFVNTNGNYKEDNFAGALAYELYTKYNLYAQGKPINVAHQIIVTKLLDQYNAEDLDLTSKQTKLLADIDYIDKQTMLNLAATYLV